MGDDIKLGLVIALVVTILCATLFALVLLAHQSHMRTMELRQHCTDKGYSWIAGECWPGR